MVLFAAVGLAAWSAGNGIPYGLNGVSRYDTYMAASAASTPSLASLQQVPGAVDHQVSAGQLLTELLLHIGAPDLPLHDVLALALSLTGLVLLMLALRSMAGPLLALLAGVVLATDYLGSVLPALTLDGAVSFVVVGANLFLLSRQLRRGSLWSPSLAAVVFASCAIQPGAGFFLFLLDTMLLAFSSASWNATLTSIAGIAAPGAAGLIVAVATFGQRDLGVWVMGPAAGILFGVAFAAAIWWLLGNAASAARPAFKAVWIALLVVPGGYWLSHQVVTLLRYPPTEIPIARALAENPTVANMPFDAPDLLPVIWYYTRGEPSTSSPQALICARQASDPAAKCADWESRLATAGYPLRDGRNVTATPDYVIYAASVDVAPDKTRRANLAGILEVDGVDLPTWLPDDDYLDLAIYGHPLASGPAGMQVLTSIVDSQGHEWGRTQTALLADAWQVGRQAIFQQRVSMPPYLPPVAMNVVVRFVTSGGEILPFLDSAGQPASPELTLGTVNMQPAQQVVEAHPPPNDTRKPVAANLTLVGYRLDQTSVAPGGLLPLSLFWQMNGRVDTFPGVQIDGLATTDLGISNSLPAGGWYYGVMEDHHELKIPAGVGPQQATVRLAGLPLGEVRIQPASGVSELPPLSHMLNLPVGDFARLAGYNVEPASPGDTLRLTLVWQALAAAPRKYKGFVHVLAAEGKVIAQEDHVLGQVESTDQWSNGQVIVDTYAVSLPADVPGAKIEVGLYDESTGKRAALGNAEQLVIPMP